MEISNQESPTIPDKPTPNQLSELFKTYQQKEQEIIDSYPWDSDPQEAYRRLSERIIALENIAYEAKSRQTLAKRKEREVLSRVSASSPAGVLPAAYKDPRKAYKKDLEKKEKDKGKLWKAVKAFIDMGNNDEEILGLFKSQKYEANEIWRCIEEIRGKK